CELLQFPVGEATPHVQPESGEVGTLAEAGGQAVPGGAGALQLEVTDSEKVAGPEMVRLQAQGVLEVAQRRRWLALPMPVVAHQEIVEGTPRPHGRRPCTLLRGALGIADLLQVAGAAQVVRLGRG